MGHATRVRLALLGNLCITLTLDSDPSHYEFLLSPPRILSAHPDPTSSIEASSTAADGLSRVRAGRAMAGFIVITGRSRRQDHGGAGAAARLAGRRWPSLTSQHEARRRTISPDGWRPRSASTAPCHTAGVLRARAASECVGMHRANVRCCWSTRRRTSRWAPSRNSHLSNFKRGERPLRKASCSSSRNFLRPARPVDGAVAARVIAASTWWADDAAETRMGAYIQHPAETRCRLARRPVHRDGACAAIPAHRGIRDASTSVQPPAACWGGAIDECILASRVRRSLPSSRTCIRNSRR